MAAEKVKCLREGCVSWSAKSGPEGYCSKICESLDIEFFKLRKKILRAERKGQTVRAAELSEAWVTLVEVSDTYTEVRRRVDYTVRAAE